MLNGCSCISQLPCSQRLNPDIWELSYGSIRDALKNGFQLNISNALTWLTDRTRTILVSENLAVPDLIPNRDSSELNMTKDGFDGMY